LERFRRDLREYARLADVPYEQSVVDPVLDSLAELWTSSWVGVRTTTHPAGRREVNARLIHQGADADPVASLRSAGLLEFTGHPMEKLLTGIPEAMPVRWGVDLSVSGGVQKIWLVFPELVTVQRMLEFPGVPDSARAHAPHLRSYGGEIGMMALDFASRTMNLYSRVFEPGTLSPLDIATILAELDFAPAGDDELAHLGRTFNVYRTFSWTSPRMQRVCFPVRHDASGFPGHFDPVLDRFVAGAPFVGTGPPAFVFFAAYGATGRYYKVQADYVAARHGAFLGGAVPSTF
jgi:hypothetical protein